jgi:putative transposase
VKDRDIVTGTPPEWITATAMPRRDAVRRGYIESFNSRIRDECLNVTSLWSLTQARVVISDWKHDYHHTAATLPWLRTPARYAATSTHQ